MTSYSLAISMIIIVWTHWIADFVFQIDSMARNKSKSNKHLMWHIRWYTTILFAGSLFLFNFNLILAAIYALVNGILHFYIDYFTSRRTSKLYSQNKLGSDKFPNFGFYSIIGLDQALHMTCLIVTWLLMVSL